MGYTDYELIEKLKVMLVDSLEEEKTVSTQALEAFMNEYRGENWLWQQACHLCEAAQVLFVREDMPNLIINKMVAFDLARRASSILPSAGQEQNADRDFDIYCTPMHYALCAAYALEVEEGKTYLEPSAGVGMLAIFVEIMGGKLVLNEINPLRYDLLTQLFPDAQVITKEDSQALDFTGKIQNAFKGDISGVIMNPPKKISLVTPEEKEWVIQCQHVARAVESTNKNEKKVFPSGRVVMISTREDLVVYYRAYSINVHDGMYRKGQTKHQTFLHVLEPKEYKTIERTTNNDYDLLELILYENESLHNLKRVSDQQSLQQQAPVACKTNKTQDDSIIIIMDVDEKGEVTTQDVPNAVLRIGTSQTPDPVAEETGSEEKPEVSYADVEGDTLAEEMTDYQLIVKLRDILHEAIDHREATGYPP